MRGNSGSEFQGFRSEATAPRRAIPDRGSGGRGGVPDPWDKDAATGDTGPNSPSRARRPHPQLPGGGLKTTFKNIPIYNIVKHIETLYNLVNNH